MSNNDHSTYAHSRDNSPEIEFELLFTESCLTFNSEGAGKCIDCQQLNPEHGHLNKTSYLAKNFSQGLFPPGTMESVNAGRWGSISGWWHDLGKFSREWQHYLQIASDPHSDKSIGKVDHSTAGAQHAQKSIPQLGLFIAYIIAGHHAGMANGIDDTESSLEKRLGKPITDYHSAPACLLEMASNLKLLPLFKTGASAAFFTRMIFSALVDADFLATESYMSVARNKERGHGDSQPSIAVIEHALDSYLEQFGEPVTSVNRRRAEILTDCRQAAEHKPGLFSLTVPTGGGKTLSSLAFALKHARLHGLRRVIYVIPYTSIIEQNAEVFRRALSSLGEDVVVEHHCNLDPDDAHQTARTRLLAENWDARIIVTTNVQFFESLHSNKPSRCRKLHRIARSVVILDEAQSLPTDLLSPSLRAIEELTTNYHSSVVLCTATQPAIIQTAEFPIGLPKVTEIISDPELLHRQLQRVKAIYQSETLSDESLAQRLRQHEQVLCIVNTRRHARAIFEHLGKGSAAFHLSALMCPKHRQVVLDTVKKRLHERLPVRLISTQLIEAGVDIDFPVVYRSVAGLDSIAQAAGRCDREGNLTALATHPGGRLYIFNPSEPPPAGHLRSTADSAKEVLGTYASEPLGLDAIEAYFRTHYWKHSNRWDLHRIMDCWPDLSARPASLSPEEWCHQAFLGFRFRDCAEKYKLIDDYTTPVIIPYAETGRERCNQLESTYDPLELRRLARSLQRYTVAIPAIQHARLVQSGAIKPLHDNTFFVLNSDGHYSDDYGLHTSPELNLSPSDSIV